MFIDRISLQRQFGFRAETEPPPPSKGEMVDTTRSPDIDTTSSPTEIYPFERFRIKYTSVPPPLIQKEPSEPGRWPVRTPEWGPLYPAEVASSVSPGVVETRKIPEGFPIRKPEWGPEAEWRMTPEESQILAQSIEAEQALKAGLPTWGWVVIVGIGLSLFLGKKKRA